MTGEEAAPILVVEDEPNIAGLLRGYLEAAGYAVAQAANGHDALALARRRQPRLILVCRSVTDDRTRLAQLASSAEPPPRAPPPEGKMRFALPQA